MKKNDIIFTLGFLIAVAVGLLYFRTKDVILGLQLGLLLLIFSRGLIFIVTLMYKISSMFKKGIEGVTAIDHAGFTIFKGTIHKKYYWRDIRWVKFDKDKFRLIFKHKNEIIIDETAIDFYCLLKNIPPGYKDFDYAYIASFFSGLKTCIVCGAVACKDSKCLSCGCSTWTEKLEQEYLNYEEYVRLNQLEIFATMEKGETFSGFKIADKNFEQDPNWTPRVTEREVQEYSEKEYWEKE